MFSVCLGYFGENHIEKRLKPTISAGVRTSQNAGVGCSNQPLGTIFSHLAPCLPNRAAPV